MEAEIQASGPRPEMGQEEKVAGVEWDLQWDLHDSSTPPLVGTSVFAQKGYVEKESDYQRSIESYRQWGTTQEFRAE